MDTVPYLFGKCIKGLPSLNQLQRQGVKRMKFDWDREWYPGEEPKHKKMKWKDYVEKHPWETWLLFVLAIGLIIWVGIK